MSANRDREEEIFDAARELAADERAAYLAERCGQDADLRQRIEGMLEADAAAGEFFKTHEAPSPTVTLADASPLIEKAGDRIGRYKLLQQIGEGGMGLVYMAEQDQPVRRSVALKIIKLGMDTRQVVARFEAERQALAMMNHPHIAKIFDAGATDSGRPYFVMELVRGIPITEYCDKNCLPTRQRLDLFILVCQAVQHAHQKGVIHRDLKPSNILVTLNDGVPWPMIIDFGIAKATHQRLTEKTLFTNFAQMIGTPAYMSPEQAEMSKLDVDTRTDIYALGVLLYELLTGSTPFPTKELLSLGYREMQRTIAEREPPHLSARLSTMANEERTVVAKNRSVDVTALAKLFRGDLDWIAMKCLEKDRARRYETANGLASDIQRHLSNEPVVACPPSNLYRFQKLVRRNKLAFAAAAAIAVVLVLGVVVSAWQAIRATHAERDQTRLRQQADDARRQAQADEKKAETEAARSAQVAQFMKGMLEGVGPSVALGRNTDMLREILDSTARRLTELKAQPAVEADLRATLGNVYLDLGEYTDAAAMHRQALALRRELLGNEHPEMGSSLNALAQALYGQGKFTEAEALHTNALTLRRKLFPEESLPVAESLNNLAESLRRQGPGKLDEAEPLLRKALATRRKLETNDHLDVACSLHNLGALLWRQNRFAEAESAYREALAIRRKLLGSEHPEVAASLDKLGLLLGAAGRRAEAEQVFREALAMRRKLLGQEHPDVAHSLQNLGFSLISQDRLAEAQPLVEEALAIRRKWLRAGHPDTTLSFQSLIGVLAGQGKSDDLEEPFRKEAELRKAEHGGESFNRGREMISAGNTLLFNQSTKPAEGQRLILRGYAILKSRGDSTQNIDSYGLGLALQNQGDLAGAERFFRQAMDFRRSHGGDTNPYLVNPLKSLAELLQTQGRPAEAEALYREELELRRKRTGQDKPKFMDWLLVFAAFLSKQGSTEKAMELYREAGELGNSRALNTMAWIHATSANPKLRDGKLALSYAQKAVAGPNENNPAHLDALAAAWAADGQFEKAVTVLQQAIPLQKDEQVKRGYLHRLKLYQASKPYRSPESLADAASALLADGKFAEADALCQEAIATAEGGEAEKWVLSEALVGLARVFHQHGKLREAEALYRAELALQRYVANSLAQLARVLREQGKLVEAAKLFRDALTIRQKSLAAGDPALVTSLAELTATLLAGEEFADAEPFARECLALREKNLPDHWLTFTARIMLGGSLLGQKKYSDAEPLLLSGYRGMNHSEEKIPVEQRLRLNEALQRIVQLYEAAGQPEKAAEWNRKLAEFDQAGAEKQVATPKPQSQSQP